MKDIEITASTKSGSQNEVRPVEGDSQHYGWFIDIEVDTSDIEDVQEVTEVTRRPMSHETLPTFQAAPVPTKSKELDAEVEWALAADTVDDVLGDFF
mmetsp:Transcript_51401/g.61864  ORF Transcript_51401/g.61864 Transcript_51401/m.61864 type:complete len:97 (+) Transcript_51401:79-369(+)